MNVRDEDVGYHTATRDGVATVTAIHNPTGERTVERVTVPDDEPGSRASKGQGRQRALAKLRDRLKDR